MKIDQPIDPSLLLRKKHAIKQELLTQAGLLEKRIAVLGGSTTAEVVDQLELFLLARGIRPTFYQSEYNRYYEDALYPGDDLVSFRPDLVYLHTGTVNINAFPRPGDNRAAVDALITDISKHFVAVWEGIEKNFQCPIIQNNFEEPWYRSLGNLDGSDFRGRSRFVARLNDFFAQQAAERKQLYIHDVHYLAARFGMDHWFNPRLWYLYKYSMDMEIIPHYAHHLAALVASVWGKAGKCLALDLDYTLWGGVVGDDGLEGIQLGNETAEAEAYSEFQRYVQAMKERGIILAVCSKNEEETARLGLMHPDSMLRPEDFAAFKANWDAKPSNIEAIAQELNIGLDSLVFVDDNPAERDIVRAQLPVVEVPEVGNDVTEFIRFIDRAALFETVSLSADDINRSQQYQENIQRSKQEASYASYDEFLQSLQMVAEITPFQSIYLDRIAQLTNKTNQFNLTTQRCTRSEIEVMAASNNWITLSGRLQDKFGDNGLVTVVAGEICGEELHLRLWLMSCRVLKRGMEEAMLLEVCRLASLHQLNKVIGYYFPTSKNKMVADFYASLGFKPLKQAQEGTLWELDLSKGLPALNPRMEIVRE